MFQSSRDDYDKLLSSLLWQSGCGSRDDCDKLLSSLLWQSGWLWQAAFILVMAVGVIVTSCSHPWYDSRHDCDKLLSSLVWQSGWLWQAALILGMTVGMIVTSCYAVWILVTNKYWSVVKLVIKDTYKLNIKRTRKHRHIYVYILQECWRHLTSLMRDLMRNGLLSATTLEQNVLHTLQHPVIQVNNTSWIISHCRFHHTWSVWELSIGQNPNYVCWGGGGGGGREL